MRTILTTVGISLLQNAKRHYGLSDGESPGDHQLANYLRHEDADVVSAETNALHQIGLRGEDRIVFLHSETPKSTLCAESLSQHYTGTVDSVFSRKIEGLSYEEKRFKKKGLRSLTGTLTELIEDAEEEGREVLINATGGFKAEIPFATLVGLLFDKPVYYIHRRFQDIIRMPVLPISPDYSLLHENRDLLEWVFIESPPATEVNQRLKGRPDKLQSLLIEDNENVSLSPTGVAIYATYIDRVEKSSDDEILLSSTARQVYKSNSSAQEKLDRIFAKLQKRKLREEKSQAMILSSNAFLYPRGRCDERVVYVKGKGGREIYVCEVFVGHQGSELRDVTGQNVDIDDYRDFQPWNPPDA